MEPVYKLVLTLTGGLEQEFTLATPVIILGRGTTCDIVLRDAKVSRTHARLECGDAGCTLVDLGSANGTRVNGAIIDRTTLAPGDVVALGDSLLRFEMAEARIEPEVTLIHSEAELEATLSQGTLPMALSNTHVPRLAVHTPGKTWEIPLLQETLTIGRHADNALVLDQHPVSRHHARIERRGEVFVVRDLHSTNGTWLGDQRVEEHTLRDGDTVRIGRAQLVWKRGFSPEDLTVVEVPAFGETPARRPVVIVPGFMGSELWCGSECMWPNVRQIFMQPDNYRLDQGEPVEPRGILGEVVIVPNLVKLEQYSRLADFLEESLGYERGRDLLEFAYDWRRDLRTSAQHLAEAIDRWSVATPITVVAHSMGCLVARYYVERLGGKKRVERLLLVGGPNYGIPKAMETLLLGPIVLPFGLFGERMREVLASFVSLYQILPGYECVVDSEGRPIDLLADNTWLPEARRPLLYHAREFRRELGTRSSVPCVSIFGYGLKTVTRVVVQRDSDGRLSKVDLATESAGDNTIPGASAVLEGTEIHPVQQHHGSLYVDNDVKMRLKLELAREPHMARQGG